MHDSRAFKYLDDVYITNCDKETIFIVLKMYYRRERPLSNC